MGTNTDYSNSSKANYNALPGTNSTQTQVGVTPPKDDSSKPKSSCILCESLRSTASKLYDVYKNSYLYVPEDKPNIENADTSNIALKNIKNTFGYHLATILASDKNDTTTDTLIKYGKGVSLTIAQLAKNVLGLITLYRFVKIIDLSITYQEKVKAKSDNSWYLTAAQKANGWATLNGFKQVVQSLFEPVTTTLIGLTTLLGGSRPVDPSAHTVSKNVVIRGLDFIITNIFVRGLDFIGIQTLKLLGALSLKSNAYELNKIDQWSGSNPQNLSSNKLTDSNDDDSYFNASQEARIAESNLDTL